MKTEQITKKKFDQKLTILQLLLDHIKSKIILQIKRCALYANNYNFNIITLKTSQLES